VYRLYATEKMGGKDVILDATSPAVSLGQILFGLVMMAHAVSIYDHTENVWAHDLLKSDELKNFWRAAGVFIALGGVILTVTAMLHCCGQAKTGLAGAVLGFACFLSYEATLQFYIVDLGINGPEEKCEKGCISAALYGASCMFGALVLFAGGCCSCMKGLTHVTLGFLAFGVGMYAIGTGLARAHDAKLNCDDIQWQLPDAYNTESLSGRSCGYVWLEAVLHLGGGILGTIGGVLHICRRRRYVTTGGSGQEGDGGL